MLAQQETRIPVSHHVLLGGEDPRFGVAKYLTVTFSTTEAESKEVVLPFATPPDVPENTGDVYAYCCEPNYSPLDQVSPRLVFRFAIINATPFRITLDREGLVTGRVMFDGQPLFQPPEMMAASSVVDGGLGECGYIALSQHLLPEEAQIMRESAHTMRSKLTRDAGDKYFDFQNVKVTVLKLLPSGPTRTSVRLHTVFM